MATSEWEAAQGRADDATADGGQARASLRAYYTLLILTLVCILNFLDRQILYILVERIRVDLAMTDTEVGLLTGLSFAIVYGIAGLWIARLADRYPRNMIIAVSVFVWSAATALGGLAQSAWQLGLTRLGVAAGESGATPAAHSLIADLFPPERRAFAIGLFALGTPIGVMIGYAGGGWLASSMDWREALFWVGMPGLVLSVVVAATIREPRASRILPAKAMPGAVSALLNVSVFRHMMAAAALFAAGMYGLAAFQPAFLVRVHGFTTAQTGLALGMLHGLGGALGTFLGGYLADRLGRRDVRWRQWVPFAGALISAPLTLAALLVDSGWLCVILQAGPIVGGLFYVAPTFGLAQTIAPPWARATASALILMAVSLVGQSCGPLLVGALSDLLRVSFGAESVRLALTVVPLLQLWSAWHFWVAGRKLPALMARARLS